MPQRSGYPFKNRYRSAYSATISSPSNPLIITHLLSVFVPANTFTAGDILTAVASIDKFGTLAEWAAYLYWNNTDDLVTPVTLATWSNISRDTEQQIVTRRLSISVANGTGNGTIAYPTGSSSPYDLTTATIGPSLVGIDWTIDSYIILAGNVISPADSIQGRWIKVNN